MAESDIFVSNDIVMDVNFGEVFVVDQGVVYKVIASKYSNTATYVVGAYVLHLEKLYRCITAIEEPEEFDAEKWTQVLLANEVQIANANIALKANADSVYDKTAIDNKISDINAAIALKANSDDVYAKADTYNKTEVDNALNTKADAATTYSKTEVDDALALKADSSAVYSKTDTDTLLNTKADKSTTYTKTEVDTALANKANSADVYTKTETYSKTEVDTDIYKKTETYSKTEVDNKIDNLPAPMIMKGTLGTGGTITDLPTASSENEGFTYKVITDGTYAGQAAKTGDVFTSAKPVGSSDYIWLYIPSGDETFTDTWRGIKVNGTEKLGSSINTGSVDFKNGTNSTAVFDPSDSSIKFNVDGYTQAQVDTKLADKANASDVYAKSETYSQAEVDSKLLNKANSSDVYTKQETYTKTEVNTALSTKADTSTVTTALALKADKATTYTKTEVNDIVDLVKTASGNPCNFETGIADKLVSLSAEIVASGGGGTPSTPIPIVGISSLDILRCGVNLWDEEMEVGTLSWADGTPIANNSRMRFVNFVPVKEGTNYKIICPSDYDIIVYDINKNHLASYYNAGNVVFTVPTNGAYIKITTQSSYGTTYNHDIGLMYPSSVSEYAPYNGQTFTIDLGGTRYGGVYTADGKLRVTWGSVDLGSINWTYNASYGFITTALSSLIKGAAYTSIANILCTIYKADSYTAIATNQTNFCIGALETYGYVVVSDNRFTDAASFKTAMSGILFAYELATPIEIDMSELSVDTIVGVNNIISDGGGDISVEYEVGDLANDVKTMIGNSNLSDLSDIPNPPTTDGNYRLKVTILDGKATYSWEEIP